MVREEDQFVESLEPPKPICRFYLTACDAWDAMYRDCERAKVSIELEQYIFDNDKLGRRFLELFIKKASEGIQVFIICDKFGSIQLLHSSLVRKLRRHGGHFYFYNPITYWNFFTPWRWFPRTHVKTLLVDSSIAYVGSACIANHMANWRDTQVCITGPAVLYIRHAFNDIKRTFQQQKEMPLTKTPPKDENFRYVVSQPNVPKFKVYEELAEAISRAKRYIYIATPFFIPHLRFFNLLKQAHGRGVEILLLVPEHSDIPLADWICISYGKKLFDAGVRVFHYGPHNLHCKIAVIDDIWATAGSANFDVISFFHNREANLVITEPAAIDKLKQQFLDDLAHSQELTPEKWQKLPLWKKWTGYLVRALKVFF
ncbi:MAG: phosphatidylserine/phosphatidylglycerophosphate/cardiolipin synthase family protein [Alphaproteobacteria bacterium]|nr:phosphatidylserine/phosphatidylglycerophosphate/cardiolipin synthase family protein [Alphaproteobacteria bacterium]